jgi:hypothetical protein
VTITLPKPKSSTVADVNVLNLRDGGVLVVIDRGDLEWIYRFTSTGKPANFGTNGVVKLDRLGPSSWYLPPRATTPLLETYDGSLIVAASGRPGQPASGEAIGLIKLSASGALVDGFADHGLWIPPTSLAEEKPLSEGTKRDAPQTLSVVGGRAAGEPLTVLFGTKHSNDIGSGTLVAATQLSEKGVRSAITKSFDQSGDGGDGGFPDALPFSFVPTAKGFSYASAWTQTGGGNTTYTYGAIGGLSPTFAPPLTPKRFNTKSKFLANDFAATPDGKHVYACGAIAQSRANRPWAKFAPALKRFDL